ncbi:MAG: methyltransferase domain-containing protein [bacterium]|nr:methyltransferase domain-containing protein [bacterium]
METKNSVNSNPQLQGGSKILQAVRGLYINNTLMAAINMDIFTLIESKPLTGKDIQSGLGLNGRGVLDFLDALVSLELLERDGNGDDALYRNKEEVSWFLVKGSPHYVGEMLLGKNHELAQIWSSLEDALKTGKPQRQDMKETGKAIFELNYDAEEKSRAFAAGMNFGQLESFTDFAVRFDFSRFHTLCDVGGGNGLLSLLVAGRNSFMTCTTLDLPPMESIAKEKIRESGLSHQVKMVKGDFFKDEFPRTDVITMGNILHDWDLEEKKLLIKKAYNSLNPNGVLVIIESIIDDERRRNTAALLMSLHMLLVTEGGFDFSAADFTGWALEAGFKRTVYMPLTGNSNAVIAYK